MPRSVEPPRFLPPAPPAARHAQPPPKAAPKAAPHTAPRSEDWPAVTKQLKMIADHLERLVGQAPATDPDGEQARAIRSATGRISAHTGTLKRRVGVGDPAARR